MRIIEGFICIASSDKHIKNLYGRNTGNGRKSWENFEENGFEPFPNFLGAKLAQEELESRQVQDRPVYREVTIGKVNMMMAETATKVLLCANKKTLP